MAKKGAAGGLKVGDLFVVFTASTSAFTKSLTQITADVAKTAKQVEAAANKIGMFGATVGAAIGGAVAVAAKHNAELGQTLDRVKSQMEGVSVEIGTAFAPAVTALADDVSRLTKWFKGLSPEVKESAVEMATTAIKIGAVSFAVGKLSGLVAALADSFTLLGKAISKAFSPKSLLPFLVMVAGIAGAIGAIKSLLPSGGSSASAATAKQTKPRPLSWEELDDEGRAKYGNVKSAYGGSNDKLSSFFDFVKIKLGVMADPKGIEQQFPVFAAPDESNFETLGKSIANGISPVLDPIQKALEEVFKKFESIDPGDEQSKPSGLDPKYARIAEELANPAPPAFDAGVVHGGVDARILPKQETNAPGVMDVVAGFGERMKDSFGRVTGVIDAAVQGFAAGPVGAIVAVLGSLLMDSVQFQEVVERVNGIVQMAANAVGMVIDGMAPLIDVVLSFAESLMVDIAPLFSFLGMVLGGLAPVVKIITNILSVALQPALWVLHVALKGVALVVLGISWALGTAWNFILSVIQGVMRIFGQGHEADKLDKLKMPTDELAQSMKDLANESYETSRAKAAERVSVERATKAADKISQSLSNVPTGLKVEALRYRATDGFAAAPSIPMAPTAPVIHDNSETTIIVHAPPTASSEEIAELVAEKMRARETRRTGRSPLLGTPRFAL